MDLDPATHELAFRLGLGSLIPRGGCSTYAAGCDCSECQARAGNVNPAFAAWLEREPAADPNQDLDPIPRLWRPAKRAVQPWVPVSRKVA